MRNFRLDDESGHQEALFSWAAYRTGLMPELQYMYHVPNGGKRDKKEKYHNTFTLMKCYRDAVFHIENAISDGQQLELKGMTDEQQRTYLESIRRTRFKTLIMTAHIDKAVEEIERRREAAGRGVEYKAFEMYFMQGMDYAEIAEELDTGKNTPRRWVTGIINELSVLLWGIDEERVK